ncbi:M28 family metallopeptidase [Phenylobacterium sp.]|jgi:Zn-dependent M28 family amino/carboxypeptidase|uniref:M28 family metallopeptidase n=1 Tax=Phenylobacterium sp. TaxID=1871053 RepID=UPI002F94084B
MSPSKVIAAALAAGLVATAVQAQPLDRSAENIRAHMAFLASDLLEGREAGSRGYDIAAEYAAAEFRKLGLKPAGDGGTYFQRVPMVSYRAADKGQFVLKGADGRSIEMVWGEDQVVSRNAAQAETRVSAPLVFVGYGVVAPERGRDDYAGLDVRGKIVVALDGAPRGYQTEERAYYRSGRTKRLEAEKRGAVGFISVETPTSEKLSPFANMTRSWQSWSMSWREPSGAAFVIAPATPQLATVSVKGAAKLFAGAPVGLEQVYAAAESEAGDPPRFALPRTAEVVMRTERQDSESRNVAALLEGSDPRLARETVVLSAHLDHVGVRRGEEADRINNGALDNAAGVATTFEAARAFVDSGRRPKRSVLFLLVTAEEKGLVGAEYFARNPTVAREGMVANVNLDMPILTYDFVDVVAFGADRSAIGPAVRRAAGRMGVKLSPDPMPEEGLFTRSDHYRFVEAGVPSTFLMTGFGNGGEAQFRGFLAKCYHKPCDDLSQPISYAAGAKFAKINYEIARELADAPQRPVWNPGDFFGEKFRRRGQAADR